MVDVVTAALTLMAVFYAVVPLDFSWTLMEWLAKLCMYACAVLNCFGDCGYYYS